MASNISSIPLEDMIDDQKFDNLVMKSYRKQNGSINQQQFDDNPYLALPGPLPERNKRAKNLHKTTDQIRPLSILKKYR